MKTLNSRMGFMMALVIGTTAFVSCSSDDEDGSNGSETTSKRIVKMTRDNGEDIKVTTFDYDSQGRVTKKNETYTGGNRKSTYTTTYTYGANTIISDETDGKSHDVKTYTLSNGRIVKEDDGSSYTYDSNGYITSEVFDSYNYQGSMKIEYMWTDGNLTKLSDGSLSGTYTISYSNILWPQNWMQSWDGTDMDNVLMPLGAWGKMPKNLPTKFVRVHDDGHTSGWTIDYTIEKGEITKAIVKDLNDNSDIKVYTIEWE